MNFGIILFLKKINLQRNNWGPISIKTQHVSLSIQKKFLSPSSAVSRAVVCACAARANFGQPQPATCLSASD